MVTKETTMGEIFKLPELKEISKYLMFVTEGDDSAPDVENTKLESVAEMGWSPEGMVQGINNLLQLIKDGRQKQYFIYDSNEATDDPLKKEVNLIHLMPKTIDENKPYVVLCAGGAYQTIATMVESLPTARHFLDAGYQVFLMTYRVGSIGVAPKALDDVGAAIQWLEAHAKQLKIAKGKYAIGGWSAGANLICNWGVPEIGYRKHNVPEPICMFPIYTFVDLKTEAKRDEHGGLVYPMFGENYKEMLDDYNVVEHVNKEYPPCYIVCGSNDGLVPPRNSEMLRDLLEESGVPAKLEEGKNARHGFGDGTGTDVEGWPERAIQFMVEVQ
ncbi:alpha/beta hydrolase fold [Lachnospiraceae bacterium C7]|nr:alpha/beta hydrolase fold [Lachnospiraceae bacterium C7]